MPPYAEIKYLATPPTHLCGEKNQGTARACLSGRWFWWRDDAMIFLHTNRLSEKSPPTINHCAQAAV